MTNEERSDLILNITSELYKVNSFEQALQVVICEVFNCAPRMNNLEKQLRKETFDSVCTPDQLEEVCKKDVLVKWVNEKLTAVT